MAKHKTKLVADAFRATQLMPPLIPASRIVLVDEGSWIKKPGELLEEPLIPPHSELFITQSSQQIISSISTPIDPIKDKGKMIAFGLDSLVKSSEYSEGWTKK